MDFKGLDSIPCFVNTVKKIISKERSSVKTTIYKEYAYSSSIHESFLIEYTGKNCTGFALFGLWFHEKPIISICINSRPWLSEQIMNDQQNIIEKMRISKPPYKEYFWDKDDVWFELSDEKLQNFINTASYDKQLIILEEFFDEVINNIQKYF